ncbi:GWxTD domain-containing protein, partial [Candidatus Kapabacteria bacterium]|nr:GWxTD domain-containing protein [Candidatus Kapabacteria bacterium]
YSNLSQLKAKKRALYKFWSFRDTDHRTEQNEARMDFEKSVEYANVYYNEPIREGWNSDRGRTLIKYGFPQQIDRYEQKSNQKACEVWFYGSDFGGLYFYFVEISNTNDYRLVNSTHPDEVSNEYWVEEYNPAIDDPSLIERNHNYMREYENNR